MTAPISIRCNACHDPERCPQCRALNAERDARFAPPADHGRMDRAIEDARLAWAMATETGLSEQNRWRAAISAALETMGAAQ